MKVLVFTRESVVVFRYWFSSGQIPHFVRDDKFFKCHSERIYLYPNTLFEALDGVLLPKRGIFLDAKVLCDSD